MCVSFLQEYWVSHFMQITWTSSKKKKKKAMNRIRMQSSQIVSESIQNYLPSVQMQKKICLLTSQVPLFLQGMEAQIDCAVILRKINSHSGVTTHK